LNASLATFKVVPLHAQQSVRLLLLLLFRSLRRPSLIDLAIVASDTLLLRLQKSAQTRQTVDVALTDDDLLLSAKNLLQSPVDVCVGRLLLIDSPLYGVNLILKRCETLAKLCQLERYIFL
jgi:hypothetical protein